MDVILFLDLRDRSRWSARINLVVQTHPISSALSLIGVMGSLAVLYLLLGAEFIAAAQVIVYAGAIMVLFVFVIMLLNAGAETQTRPVAGAYVAGRPAPGRASSGCSRFVIQRAVPVAAMVHFGGFTRRHAARHRPRPVHRLPAAVRSDLGADPDRHPGRDRAGAKGDRLDDDRRSRFPGT